MAVALAMATLMVTPAWAHVTIDGEGMKGGFGKFAISVPNESDGAPTVKLEVQFPQDHPLAYVSVQEKPGWTVERRMRTLEQAVEAFGSTVTEVVDVVTWTGGSIGVNRFDEFVVEAGPFPSDVDQLEFRAVQTYSDGQVVSWIEPTVEGQQEPEHPAPVLTLTGTGTGAEAPHGEGATAGQPEEVEGLEAAAPGAPATQANGGSGSALAVTALVIALLGLIVGGSALALALRRSTTKPT